MSEGFSANLMGVAVQIHQDPGDGDLPEGSCCVVQADDNVAVMVNGRVVTKARNNELGYPNEYWDMSEGKNPIDGTVLVWRFPDGTVAANVDAELDRAEARRVAAKLLEASGVSLVAIVAFLGGLPSEDA